MRDYIDRVFQPNIAQTQANPGPEKNTTSQNTSIGGVVDQSANSGAVFQVRTWIKSQQEVSRKKLETKSQVIAQKLKSIQEHLSTKHKINLRLSIDTEISYGERLRLEVYPQERGQVDGGSEAEIFLNPEFALRLASPNERNLTLGHSHLNNDPWSIINNKAEDAQMILYGELSISSATNNQVFLTENERVILDQKHLKFLNSLVSEMPRYTENGYSDKVAILKSYLTGQFLLTGFDLSSESDDFSTGDFEERVESAAATNERCAQDSIQAFIDTFGEDKFEYLEELLQDNPELYRNFVLYCDNFDKINGYHHYEHDQDSVIQNLFAGAPFERGIRKYNDNNKLDLDRESNIYALETVYYRDSGILNPDEQFRVILEQPSDITTLRSEMPRRNISIVLSEDAKDALLNANRSRLPKQLMRDINAAVLKFIPQQFH